jgi:urea transport system ATP-binding protein
MLNVNQLHVSYGQSEVLHGITFSAKKNETVAIMGRNGMGKTTLFKSLIGILPLRSGTIDVDGQDISKAESYARVAKGVAGECAAQANSRRNLCAVPGVV